MSRGLRIAMVALLVTAMAQGVRAAEGVSSVSWFDSVVAAVVSFFDDSGSGTSTESTEAADGEAAVSEGDEPETGPISVPWG